MKDLDSLAEEFQKEAYEFCLKASERGIRTVLCFVIEDPLTSTHVDDYTGAGMRLHETIGTLEATAFYLKSKHCAYQGEPE